MDDANLPLVRRLADATLQPAGNVHMTLVYPWEGVVQTHFGAGWAVVGPGERTERHMHHEGETWFVMEGRADLTVDGTTREVGPGDTIYLPPFRSHTLHNPSTTDRVVFLTVWWEDAALSRERLEEDARDAGAQDARASVNDQSRVVLNLGPPTPNGDLHLGHLSGPCIAADVLLRALKLEGVDVSFVTGADDHQCYVAGRALQEGRTPQEVADDFAARVYESLGMADIHPDQYMRPTHTEGYVEAIQNVFRRLHREGHLVAREMPCLRDPDDGSYLFEFYVSGGCPHCGEPAGGGGCEECGLPNDAHDLVDPRTTIGDKVPVKGTVTRLVFELGKHAARLREWLEDAVLPPHVRAVVEAAIESGLPDFPATHPHHWGVPCPIEGFEDQFISSWIEVPFGTLAAVREHARSCGLPFDDKNLTPLDAPDIVYFIGFDIGFPYALLFTALLEVADPSFSPPRHFVMNEYYLLDGLKFSTSRNHAVWIRDICAREPSDLVRFYVCYDRPETARANFTENAYQRFVDASIRGTWGDWLEDLDARLRATRDGLAPEPGYWMREHKAFLAFLESTRNELRDAYAIETFSARRATRALLRLVEETRAFAESQHHLATAPARANELRTAQALELAAARLLALGVSPIMPRFAERLFRGLGETHPVAEASWPEGHGWVAEGTAIDLREAGFPPRDG